MLSFSSDDQLNIRQKCLGMVRTFGHADDFPINFLPSHLVSAMLTNFEDTPSAAMAVAEAIIGRDEGLGQVDSEGVFEKSLSSASSETSRVKQQIRHAFIKWTSDTGTDEVKLSPRLKQEWDKICQDGDVKALSEVLQSLKLN